MWYLEGEDSEIGKDYEDELEEEDVVRESHIFSSKVSDLSCGVAVFGTVPMRISTPKEAVQRYTERLATTIRKLDPDAIIVYDIQDEESRSGEERPFAFAATHEPRTFAKNLFDLTNIDPIVYRATPYYKKEDFEQWLTDSYDDYSVQNLVLVGGSSKREYQGYSVAEATHIVRNHKKNYSIGGITIPERHRDRWDEHERLLEKTENGIKFFTSQVIYDVDSVISMLKDYDTVCKHRGIPPARILLTFAPFGRDDTVKFLNWLGVGIPKGTVARVLSRGTPEISVDESVQICEENFVRILDASVRCNISVPLGISVESVSKYRDEFIGAVRLFKNLKTELSNWMERNGPFKSVNKKSISSEDLTKLLPHGDPSSVSS